MFIRDMSDVECQALLMRMRVGRLACTRARQPYIVPLNLAYANGYLYGFSAPGLKIEWMRANPKVCVQIDEVVSAGDWSSVVLLGRYRELPDKPKWKSERLLAWTLAQRIPSWWQPGLLREHRTNQVEPAKQVWFRIEPQQITGRQGSEPVKTVKSSARLKGGQK